jgi:hypothetical protein
MLQPLGLQFIAAYLLNIVAKIAQKIGLAIGYCSPCYKLNSKTQLLILWVVFPIAVIKYSLLT